MNKYLNKTNYLLLLYLIAWLFPIVISYIISSFGYNFSYTGSEWQQKNNNVVLGCLMVATLTYIVICIIVFKYIKKINIVNFFDKYEFNLDNPKLIYLTTVLLISGYGLYSSFEGNIFQKIYNGPVKVWLSYGAWSVTYSLIILLITFKYIRKIKPISIYLLITVLFIPFLMCGSRIDYLSSIIPLIVYLLSTRKIVQAISIALVTITVIVYIGNIRYTYNKETNSIDLSSATDIKKQNFHYIDNLNINNSHLNTSDINNTKKTPILYISTIGDIGASIYQVIGLKHKHEIEDFGLMNTLKVYILRLIPGSFNIKRPNDIVNIVPESIGGGSLHSIAEAYLIKKYIGVILYSAAEAFMACLSLMCLSLLNKNKNSYLKWLIFVLPWFMIIRSGWYQFYSIIKTIEIIFFYIILFLIIYKTIEKIYKHKNNKY